MIFICDSCGAIFDHPSEPEQCPDCGKDTVRPASEVEQEEFTAHFSGASDGELYTPFPDIVETEIEVIDCFKFKLPATALQIDSDMIMEIVVEHGISPANQNMVIANIWARPVGGVLSGFLMPLQVQSIPNEPFLERAERITAAMNESDSFMEQLHKFVAMLMNSGK